MLARKKFSYEERLSLVKNYLDGKISRNDARKLYGDFELILKQYQYNGPMEGFWGILKREKYYGKRFESKESLVEMIENILIIITLKDYNEI